jgi:hypothetical protein
MGDMGDYWREHREYRKSRGLSSGRGISVSKRVEKEGNINKWKREKKKYVYTQFSDYHFRVGDYDFCPPNSIFLNRKTGDKGYGIDNFLELIKGYKKNESQRTGQVPELTIHAGLTAGKDRH